MKLIIDWKQWKQTLLLDVRRDMQRQKSITCSR